MARISTWLLLAAVLSFMHASEGMSFRELFHQVWEESPYDKLIIAYRWAPSYCKREDCIIKLTAKKEWTIRGLWPYKNGEENNPEYCPGPSYDRNDISDLRQKMIKKWPTFKIGETNDKFWKETYEKYGTCVKDMTKFNTINKYFKNTLDLYDKYKMKEILADGDSSVTPSITKKYILSEITSALNKGLGVDPAVYCVGKDNEQYLWEIRMCYSKKLKAINCGTSHVNGDTCDSEKKISYPKFSPLVIG